MNRPGPAEKKKRVANLPDLVLHKSPAVRLFAQFAFASMNAGDPGKVNWKAVEGRVIDAAMADAAIDKTDIAEALCSHSPGAVFPSRQAAIRKAAGRFARE